MFQGKIRAEAFSGWSDFDLNSTDEIEGNPDRGFLGRISYTPNPFTFKGRPSSFILQTEIQDIGLFYRSLGNPFLVADRRGLNLTSTWTVGAISLIGGASRFHDNVKNSPLLAKVNNTGYTAGVAITPVPTGTSFTLPSFALNYTRTEQDSENEPVAFMGIKNRINNFASIVSWNVNRLNLGLNANHSMNRDENNRVPDTNVTQATLALSYVSSAAMNFGPSIAYTRQSDLDSRINQQLWTYSLTSSLPLFRPDFILNNQISLSTVDSSNSLSLSSNFSGTAQLLWNLNQTWQNRGTQTLSLRISYNRNLIEAPFFTLTKGLEVFAAVSFGWPLLNTWEGK